MKPAECDVNYRQSQNALTFASWNHIGEWLMQVEALRQGSMSARAAVRAGAARSSVFYPFSRTEQCNQPITQRVVPREKVVSSGKL